MPDLLRRRTLAMMLPGLAAVAGFVPAMVSAADAKPEFIAAIKRNRGSDVRTWLLRGVDPNQPDPAEGPPLLVAINARADASVKALLESPELDVNALNAKGENGLMRAALLGDLVTTKLLIARSAEVNKPGWTPLHFAATAGSLELVQLLVANDAYLDAQSPNNTTPAMMAARQGHKTLVRYLIDEGADPTQRNDAGLSIADYLRRSGDAEMADWVQARAREFEARYGTIQAPKIPASRQNDTGNQGGAR